MKKEPSNTCESCLFYFLFFQQIFLEQRIGKPQIKKKKKKGSIENIFISCHSLLKLFKALK